MKPWLLILTACLVWLTAAAGRQYRIGHVAIQRSDSALALGDLRTSCLEARKSAEAALPGSPFPTRGFTRLRDIASDAERKGDARMAILAWSHMDAAARSSASAWQPRDEEMREASDALSRLRSVPAPNTPPASNTLGTAPAAPPGASPNEALAPPATEVEALPESAPTTPLLFAAGTLAFAIALGVAQRTHASRGSLRLVWVAAGTLALLLSALWVK